MLALGGLQTPLLMTHSSTFVPNPTEVNSVDGELGETIVAKPEISDHVPIPTVGMFAAIVAVVTQIV